MELNFASKIKSWMKQKATTLLVKLFSSKNVEIWKSWIQLTIINQIKILQTMQ